MDNIAIYSILLTVSKHSTALSSTCCPVIFQWPVLAVFKETMFGCFYRHGFNMCLNWRKTSYLEAILVLQLINTYHRCVIEIK